MFSKELENLIQATLEDGKLEEYEKAALVKRAQAEGVDLTELEIYINSILQKRQKEIDKERNEQVQMKAQEKKEAIGPVCPKCGKQVPPMTLKCECGYEFTKAEANTSVQLLVEKIDIINLEAYLSRAEREEKIREAIEMFPVPNTKEDILEFLSMGASSLQDKIPFLNTYNGRVILYSVLTGGWFYIIGLFTGWLKKLEDSDDVMKERRQKAWRTKCTQILLKGRSLRGDADFQRQLDYYEQLINKK